MNTRIIEDALEMLQYVAWHLDWDGRKETFKDLEDLIIRIKTQVNQAKEHKPMKIPTLDDVIGSGQKHMPFNPAKPVQLRNGQPAVILEVMEGVEKYPIFGRMQVQGCAWLPSKWTSKGQYDVENYNDHSYDLINIPEAPEVAEFWLNVYKNASGYSCREETVLGGIGIFARVKISCTKGEGL